MSPSLTQRASGILLHLTSLPGPHGCGDLGPSAHRFVEWLASSGQRWWQMLPVGPLGSGDSPYQTLSAFAGNPRFIARGPLHRAVAAVERNRHARKRLEAFCQRHAWWLNDYALFCALKQAHRAAPWTAWDAPLRRREPEALTRASRRLAQALRSHQVVQYLFAQQWEQLRQRCRRLGIGLIGDVPIFVAHDSADVWAHQDFFQLDPDGRMLVVAGAPPDHLFNREGQRWGNPLYRWDRLRQQGHDWWLKRLGSTFERFDAARLDHFIGFSRCWEVPADSPTARHGRFVPGPGAEFFQQVFRSLGPIQLIAEDLGLVTPEVRRLRDQFHLPGMRVLQFGFGDGSMKNEHLPHHYPARCVAYTGTHDNDTAVGWFRARSTLAGPRSREALQRERAFALRYLRCDGRQIHWDMVRAILQSPANTTIIPLQDVLGLGSSARMNRPGTARKNWTWRLAGWTALASMGRQLRQLTEQSGRCAAVNTRHAIRTRAV